MDSTKIPYGCNSHPDEHACNFVRSDCEFKIILQVMTGIGPADNQGSAYRVLEE